MRISADYMASLYSSLSAGQRPCLAEFSGKNFHGNFFQKKMEIFGISIFSQKWKFLEMEIFGNGNFWKWKFLEGVVLTPGKNFQKRSCCPLGHAGNFLLENFSKFSNCCQLEIFGRCCFDTFQNLEKLGTAANWKNL